MNPCLYQWRGHFRKTGNCSPVRRRKKRDELTKRVHDLEKAVIHTINQSGLPPIVVDLALSGILNNVKQIEAEQVPAEKAESTNELFKSG